MKRRRDRSCRQTRTATYNDAGRQSALTLHHEGCVVALGLHVARERELGIRILEGTKRLLWVFCLEGMVDRIQRSLDCTNGHSICLNNNTVSHLE